MEVTVPLASVSAFSIMGYVLLLCVAVVLVSNLLKKPPWYSVVFRGISLHHKTLGRTLPDLMVHLQHLFSPPLKYSWSKAMGGIENTPRARLRSWAYCQGIGRST